MTVFFAVTSETYANVMIRNVQMTMATTIGKSNWTISFMTISLDYVSGVKIKTVLKWGVGHRAGDERGLC